MRRLAALTMLALFLLFSGAPLLVAATASPDAGLPPCCRRHGKHHCARMDAWLRARASRRPAWSAPPAHCPFYPQPRGQAVPVPSCVGLATQPLQLKLALPVVDLPAVSTPGFQSHLQMGAPLRRGPPGRPQPPLL